MELGEDHLKVERASVGHQQAQDLQMNVGAMSILAGQNTGDLEKGRVLELMNMVTIEELMDGEEYDGKSSASIITCEQFTDPQFRYQT